MNKILLYAVALLLLTSCSKTLSFFNYSPDRFNLNNVDYQYISLKSKVKYEDNRDKHRGIVNIRICKDSAVWFSVTPGMGIEAARGIITKDSIIIIDKINKQYTTQRIDSLSSKLHFNLNISLIESILIGNLFWPISPDDKMNKTKTHYEIFWEKGDLNITNSIGMTSMKLEKVVATSDSSSSTLYISYNNFQMEAEKIVPKDVDAIIKFKSKKDGSEKFYNITLEHTKVEIDKKLKFSFNIPKKYDRK